MTFLGQFSSLTAWRSAALLFFAGAVFFGLATSAQAANTINTAQYLDTNANGTVDTIRLTMDENVTTCTYEAGDWTVNTASELSIVITGVSCTGSNAILNISVTADALETGHTTAPVISYSNGDGDNSIGLTSGAMTAKSNVTITDGAAPQISLFQYNDSDGDGKIDRIDVEFTEQVAAGSVLRNADLTFSNVGSFTGAAFGSGTTDLITIARLALSVDLGTEATAIATADESGNLAFATQNLFSVVDAAGNTNSTLGAQSQATLEDQASPVVASISPADGASGVSRDADVVMVFSEPMDTTFAEGTEFSISPDPGSFSAGWTNSNKTLTLTTPTLACTTYAFTTDVTNINASTGFETQLATGGPSDGDSTFVVTGCGSSSGGGATLVPSNVSITYNGPVCTTDNTHSFTLSADNAAEYIVDSSNQFINGVWNAFTDNMSVNVALDADDTIAYFRLRSSTMGQTDTFSEAVSDWTGACATDNDDDDQTPDDDDDTVTPPSVTPVAGVSPGDVIVSSLSSTVYYVTENYGRKPFINEATYFTWFNSFDDVKTVSTNTLSALPLEGNMLPKAGVVLVKIQSVADVFALTDDNDDLVPELRLIEDEAMAISLYGNLWADYVIDIEPTFFTKFDTGADMDGSEDVNTSIMKRRVDL